MELHDISLINFDLFALILPLIISFLRTDSSNIENGSYFKKTTLTIYFITLLSLSFIKNINILLILILIYPIAGSLSLIISDNELDMEKELKFHQFFIYHLFKWIVYIRFDIFVYYILALYFLFYFEPDINKSLLMISPILITLTFVSLHIIINSKEQFSVKSFAASFNTLKQATNDNNTLSDNELEVMSYLVTLEDQYFFCRSKLFFSFPDIYFTLRRKILNLINRIRGRRVSMPNTNYFKGNTFKKAWKFLKQKVRGYSTIEQQVIRTIGSGRNSFRYKYRRKVFIEYIYNHYLFCAIVNQRVLHYRNEKVSRKELIKQLKENYRYNLLVYHYKNIFNTPQNIDDLTNTLSKHSRVSVDVYNNILIPAIDLDSIKTIKYEIQSYNEPSYTIFPKN